MTLSSKQAQFNTNVELFQQFMQGGANTTIATAGGELKSLLKLQADFEAGLGAFQSAGAGAAPRTVRSKLRESVSVNDYMTDEQLEDALSGSPVLDHASAFTLALAASKTVQGDPGCTYRIASTVTVASNKRLLGNGAQIEGTAGVVAFHIIGDRNRFFNWDIDANGALYFIRNDGQRNAIEWNDCTGDVGHYVFSPGARYPRVCNNVFDGQGIYLITTSVVFQDCRSIKASDNTFSDIEHWGIQVRGATKHGSITGNILSAGEYTDSKVATNGQTVFNFTISNACHLAVIQVDGLPFDTGLTFNPVILEATPTTNFTVTFAVAPAAGAVVKLIAHRAAENIQINGTSSGITISNNTCEGGGDSGILLAGLSRRCTVTNNIVSRFAYAGISLEGGVTGCVVSGNIIFDCALGTTAATYASGILLGGGDNSVSCNTIENTITPPTMRYGVSVNTYDIDDGGVDKSLKIGPNKYIGPFVKKVYIPNQDANKRRQSIELLDGLRMDYPAQIDLDSAWTNHPADTPYFDFSGFGGSFAIRDTEVKRGGIASLKTVAGEYVDIKLLAGAMLQDTVVDLSFQAKCASGSSYCNTFLEIGESVVGSPSCQVTDTGWKQYRLTFAVTEEVDVEKLSIRFGSTTGSANFQHIKIAATAIP